MISSFVPFIPSFPRRPMLTIVASTPFVTIPSPATNSCPRMNMLYPRIPASTDAAILAAQEAFASIGVTYLFNEGVRLGNNIYLAGIPDTKTVKHINEPIDLQKAFNSADVTNFKILMSHRPKVFDALSEGEIDFVISAHTHGGQIFPFHILSKLDNKYLAGLYEEKNGMLYVSRGCGQWGPQMRFLAPSEISIIRILPWTDEAAQKSLKNNSNI